MRKLLRRLSGHNEAYLAALIMLLVLLWSVLRLLS
jgi:hypothetical protein